jgi:hypothetical protein
MAKLLWLGDSGSFMARAGRPPRERRYTYWTIADPTTGDRTWGARVVQPGHSRTGLGHWPSWQQARRACQQYEDAQNPRP